LRDPIEKPNPIGKYPTGLLQILINGERRRATKRRCCHQWRFSALKRVEI